MKSQCSFFMFEDLTEKYKDLLEIDVDEVVFWASNLQINEALAISIATFLTKIIYGIYNSKLGKIKNKD